MKLNLRFVVTLNIQLKMLNNLIFYSMTQSYCGAFNSDFFSVESRQAWPNYHFVCATNEDRFPCFLHVKLSWCMIYIDVPAKTTFDRWNLYYVKRLKKGKTWLVFTIGWFLSWPYSYYDTISFHINYTGIFYWKWNRIFFEICYENKFLYHELENKLKRIIRRYVTWNKRIPHNVHFSRL